MPRSLGRLWFVFMAVLRDSAETSGLVWGFSGFADPIVRRDFSETGETVVGLNDLA